MGPSTTNGRCLGCSARSKCSPPFLPRPRLSNSLEERQGQARRWRVMQSAGSGHESPGLVYTANTSRGHERPQHTQPNKFKHRQKFGKGLGISAPFTTCGSSPCFGGTTACGYPFSTAKIASCSARLSKKRGATMRKLLRHNPQGSSRER